MTTTLRGVLVERPRISAIDIMRGLVMVIMALDHTRDFFHADSFLFDPTDLSKTTPALFYTRWITHFCAPTFVFLAGTAIHISSRRKSKSELRKFLLTRGLWLVFIEVVVIRFGILFNLYYDVIIFQVIWVIAVSMIVMGLLVGVKDTYLFVLGIIITIGHNLLDGITFSQPGVAKNLWFILHQQGVFPISENMSIMVFYPLLPWIGIILMGFGFGKIYSRDYDILRPTYLVLAGIIMVLMFIGIRYLNIYGDLQPWKAYDSLTFTIMSFLNCTKYPPSLLYTLMTLGPMIIGLGLLEKIQSSIFQPLLVFGRVPLFYYIIHFYLIHLVGLLFYLQKSGKTISDIDFHFSQGLGGLVPGAGYSLPYVYLAWLAIVIFLYPLCAWYNNYKSRTQKWWVSYI